MPGSRSQSHASSETGQPAHPGTSIAQLVDSLVPVRAVGRSETWALLWWVAAWLGVGLTLPLLGPLRPGAPQQLVESGQFLLEGALGLASGIWLALAGFAICIPGPRLLRRTAPAAALFAAWLGSYVYALWDPALPPAMRGKRPGCELQVLGLGLALLGAALLAARRLAPLKPALAGALLGAAAGGIPALWMQFACMYAVSHIFGHHLAPALMLAALGAATAPRVLAPP